MLPELFSVDTLTIHSYGVLVALGILAAVILGEQLHRRSGGRRGWFMDTSLFVVLGGVTGARLIFVVINREHFSDRPLEALLVWKGGLVFYGGLLGGAGTFLVAVLYNHLPLRETLDTAAAAVALGHAFGRLGCFTAGCCYGAPSDLPWAVTFTDPFCLAVEVLHMPVHPVQLYSSLFLAGLTVFLVWLHRRRTYPGQVCAAYLLCYGLFRFGVEFLRGDPRGAWEVFGVTLSAGQWLSVPVFLAGFLMAVFLPGTSPPRGIRRRRGGKKEGGPMPATPETPCSEPPCLPGHPSSGSSSAYKAGGRPASAGAPPIPETAREIRCRNTGRTRRDAA